MAFLTYFYSFIFFFFREIPSVNNFLFLFLIFMRDEIVCCFFTSQLNVATSWCNVENWVSNRSTDPRMCSSIDSWAITWAALPLTKTPLAGLLASRYSSLQTRGQRKFTWIWRVSGSKTCAKVICWAVKGATSPLRQARFRRPRWLRVALTTAHSYPTLARLRIPPVNCKWDRVVYRLQIGADTRDTNEAPRPIHAYLCTSNRSRLTL